MVSYNEKDFQIIINTDGACSNNPGKIGIGGVIVQKYPENKTMTFSQPLGYGTNNEAEYLAIIKALETAIALKPQSVLVQSDSKLAVNQINGIYDTKQDHLAVLCNIIRELVSSIQGEVVFRWIPRSQNCDADALASKAVGQLRVSAKKEMMFLPLRVDTDKLLKVNFVCQESLSRIINLGENAKFKDYVSLKTGGQDDYSQLNEKTLVEQAEIRFGKRAVEWLKKTVESFSSEYGKTVLRWTARGLPPDMALKKVSVDAEVRANAIKRKTG